MSLLHPARAVVFPADRGLELVRAGCSTYSPDTARISGYWEPAPDQIRLVDFLLGRELRQRLVEHPVGGAEAAARVAEYHRQYVGIILEGRRLVYVSGFHGMILRRRYGDSDWRSSPVSVCDGGLGFFTAAVDLRSGTVVAFGFNGFA